MTFAKYNVLQDIGHAAGSLLAGIPALLHAFAGVAPDAAQRDSLWVYVVLCAVPLLAYARLSPTIEAPRVTKSATLTPESRRTLAKISALFAIDSVGAGVREKVLVVLEGRAAGEALGRKGAPVDAAIVAIVDQVDVAETA